MSIRNARWQLVPPATMLPAMRYEIRIAGALSHSLVGAFPDFRAELCGGETVLEGALPDQPALHGVLAQIEALGLELVEVRQRLESREGSDDNSPRRARESRARPQHGAPDRPLGRARGGMEQPRQSSRCPRDEPLPVGGDSSV
jgi:hypothetical protein